MRHSGLDSKMIPLFRPDWGANSVMMVTDVLSVTANTQQLLLVFGWNTTTSTEKENANTLASSSFQWRRAVFVRLIKWLNLWTEMSSERISKYNISYYPSRSDKKWETNRKDDISSRNPQIEPKASDKYQVRY